MRDPFSLLLGIARVNQACLITVRAYTGRAWHPPAPRHLLSSGPRTAPDSGAPPSGDVQMPRAASMEGMRPPSEGRPSVAASPVGHVAASLPVTCPPPLSVTWSPPCRSRGHLPAGHMAASPVGHVATSLPVTWPPPLSVTWPLPVGHVAASRSVIDEISEASSTSPSAPLPTSSDQRAVLRSFCEKMNLADASCTSKLELD